MTAKRPHWEMAGESPPPAAAHHPILPPLASVCGDVFSRMLPMHGAPTLQRPTSGDAFLQPRASWPQLPMPSSEPLRQSTSSTGVVPRVRVTSPEMKRSQHPAGPGFSRQLPLSPSRQDSQSSDASQETPVQDEVDEDDGSASEPTKKPRSSADRWLAEEDEQLRNAVRAWEATSTGGLCPWRTLATRVGGGHSAAQCAQRWRRVLRPELKKGPWIVEHEERLIRLVLELGPMWAKVSTRMGDRSDIQCRYWFRKLRQMGADNWTTADDALLRRLYAEYGTDWRAIAKGLESATRSKRAHSASACLARVLLVHPSMK